LACVARSEKDVVNAPVRALVLAVALAVLMTASEARAGDAPPEHRGFQLTLRAGGALPFGQVTPTTAMSDAFGAQAAFLADIGWKPISHLFIGVFVGTAVGGAAGQVARTCEQLAVNCVGVGYRAGVLVEWNLRPRETVNPWFGYGFGYELGSSSGSKDRTSISNSFRGFEFAHVLAGVDFRLQDWFGIGPFVDGAIGSYGVAESETNQGGRVAKRGGVIEDTSLHLWLTFGVRIVLLP
jgi:hypothetical protein